MERSAITRKLAALATAGMAVQSAPENAWSCGSSNIAVAASGFNNLISLACWIGGIGFCFAGAFKIRKRRKAPASQPLRGVIIRLCVGLALLAFPFIQQAMQEPVTHGSLQKIQTSTLILDNTDSFK